MPCPHSDCAACPDAGSCGALFLTEDELSVLRRFAETDTRIENQIFLACCNGCGTAGETVYGGHSAIYDPWGEVKAEAGDGEEIILSALEYRLLLLFANNQGIVLTRAKLLQDLWDVGGEYVNDNTLTVYIKRLREKIEDDPAQPMLIRTIRGFGYKAGE